MRYVLHVPIAAPQINPYQSRILQFITASFQKDKPPCELPQCLRRPISRDHSRDRGNTDDGRIMTLFLFSSSPLYPPLLIHSPHFFSSFLSLSLPDCFSSHNFRTSSFLFSRPVSSCLRLRLATFADTLSFSPGSSSSCVPSRLRHLLTLARSVLYHLFLIGDAGQWAPSSPLASLHSSKSLPDSSSWLSKRQALSSWEQTLSTRDSLMVWREPCASLCIHSN